MPPQAGIMTWRYCARAARGCSIGNESPDAHSQAVGAA